MASPPASLGVADAARNYLEYALSPDAWALGRFVVSVLRLEELRDVAEGLVSAVAGVVSDRISAATRRMKRMGADASTREPGANVAVTRRLAASARRVEPGTIRLRFDSALPQV